MGQQPPAQKVLGEVELIHVLISKSLKLSTKTVQLNPNYYTFNGKRNLVVDKMAAV